MLITDNRSGNGIVSSKELPTSKWRRDRRIRFYSEYSHFANGGSPSVTVKPLSESNSGGPTTNSLAAVNPSPSSSTAISGHIDSMVASATADSLPLDMSVLTSVQKNPPPPYREPLPGSTFANALVRPSVITQAPKRDAVRMAVDANQENKDQLAMGNLFKTFDPNHIF